MKIAESKRVRAMLAFATFVVLLLIAAAVNALIAGKGCPYYPDFDPGTCTEYWLNRYQSLITGILAAAAAGGTIFFLIRQMHDERERHAIQIRLQTAPERIEVERQASFLIDELVIRQTVLDDVVRRLYNGVKLPDAEIIAAFQSFAEIEKSSSFIELRRRVFGPEVQAIREVKSAAFNFLRATDNILSQPHFAIHSRRNLGPQPDPRWSRIDDRRRSLNQAVKKAITQLDELRGRMMQAG